jgi:CheY-like chemotaxis protein
MDGCVNLNDVLMNSQAKETYLVYMADDSEGDRLLFKAALKRAASLQLIGEATNGHDVMAYLKGHGPFANREEFPLPDLLLLDLKMPRKDGFEVLEWLRTQSLENLTVVVLTDSMQPEHIKRALDLGADLFQVKPVANHDREAMVLALESYMLNSSSAPLAHLPVSAGTAGLRS